MVTKKVSMELVKDANECYLCEAIYNLNVSDEIKKKLYVEVHLNH